MASKLIVTLSKISLGVVLVLLLLWFYIKADLYFPINTTVWKDKILTYMIITALVFSVNSLATPEKALFRTSFLKRFPVFIIAAIITLAILFTFGLIFKGESLLEIKQGLSYVSFGALVLLGLVAGISEQFIFFGWLKAELIAFGMRKAYAVALVIGIFAFFHYSLQGDFLLLGIYIPLGYIFNYVAEKYSPKTHMADSGVHAGWNWYILSVLN